MASIEALGAGIAKLRTTAVPRYVEMVSEDCERMEWNRGAFRCFRCQIEYPIFGSQVSQAFDLPKPRADERT